MKVKAIGGPYNGKMLELTHPATHTFECKGMIGQYVKHKNSNFKNAVVWKENK